MCQINKDNSACSYQHHFQRWRSLEKTGQLPNEVAKNYLALPESNTGYCLFHSDDIEWKKEHDFDRYVVIFFKLSEWDGTVMSINMTNTVFVASADKSDLNLNGSSFKKKLRIAHSRFVDNLHFKSSLFENDVDFFRVRFEGEVYFNESKSFKAFFFVRCNFFKKAYFNAATFWGETGVDYSSFNFSVFEEQANFSGCKFLGKNSDANFQLITFKGIVYFTGSIFEKRGLFDGTKFEKRADFGSVTFQQDLFFTVRSEEGKVYIPEFTEANFSRALFHGNVVFNDASMGRAVFSEAQIFSMLQFTNTVFTESAFDDIFLGSNGRIHFTGNQGNLVFTDSVAFHIIRERFEGYIYFKQIKVAFITAPHLKVLEELRKDSKVFFADDCEFSVNSNYVDYEIKGAEGNYILFDTIFKGLETWVWYFFRSSTRISVEVAKIDPSKNIIRIKVKWKQQQDFDLYVNLAIYYFQSLPFQNNDQIAFFTKLSDEAFLKSLLGQDQDVNMNIKAELEDHIDIVSYTIKKILRRCSIIEFEVQPGKEVLYEKTPGRNLSAYQINLRSLNDDVKQALSATFFNMTKQQSPDKTELESVIYKIEFININTLIKMDTGDKYTIGDINQEGKNILQIGKNISANYTMSENDLDFNKLMAELPQLIGALKSNQDSNLKKEDIDAIIAAHEASKSGNKKVVMEILGSVGKGVVDIASKIGIEYVKGFLPK